MSKKNGNAGVGKTIKIEKIKHKDIFKKRRTQYDGCWITKTKQFGVSATNAAAPSVRCQKNRACAGGTHGTQAAPANGMLPDMEK